MAEGFGKIKRNTANASYLQFSPMMRKRHYDESLGLLYDQKWSDLVIKCGTERWTAHKAILFTRCPELAQYRLIKSDTGHSELDISSDIWEAWEVQLLLEFIYTDVLDIPAKAQQISHMNISVPHLCGSSWRLGGELRLLKLRDIAEAALLDYANHEFLPVACQCSPYASSTGEDLHMLEEFVMAVRREFQKKTAGGTKLPRATPIRNMLVRMAAIGRFYLFQQPTFLNLLRDIPKFTNKLLLDIVLGSAMDTDVTPALLPARGTIRDFEDADWVCGWCHQGLFNEMIMFDVYGTGPDMFCCQACFFDAIPYEQQSERSALSEEAEVKGEEDEEDEVDYDSTADPELSPAYHLGDGLDYELEEDENSGWNDQDTLIDENHGEYPPSSSSGSSGYGMDTPSESGSSDDEKKNFIKAVPRSGGAIPAPSSSFQWEYTHPHTLPQYPTVTRPSTKPAIDEPTHAPRRWSMETDACVKVVKDEWLEPIYESDGWKEQQYDTSCGLSEPGDTVADADKRSQMPEKRPTATPEVTLSSGRQAATNSHASRTKKSQHPISGTDRQPHRAGRLTKVKQECPNDYPSMEEDLSGSSGLSVKIEYE